MRVAILGRTQMLYRAIEVLLAGGHEIALIGTCKAAPEYRKTEEDYKQCADKLSVSFFCDSNINKPAIVEQIKSVRADIGISMNWPVIISEQVIKIFPYGILNAHPGDLPRYRGNACPNWAIINGERELAISIHYMVANKLDAGDIILKKRYSNDSTMNITKFYEIMERDIPCLFLEALNRITCGSFDSVPPDDNLLQDTSRCYPRRPSDSYIDWNMECNQILRLINASGFPFQGAYTFYEEKKIHIMECSVKEFESPCYVVPGQIIKVDKENNCIEIAAKDGVIAVSEVYIDGKAYDAIQILKSTRIRLNYCTEEEIYILKKQICELRKEIELLKQRI